MAASFGTAPGGVEDVCDDPARGDETYGEVAPKGRRMDVMVRAAIAGEFEDWELFGRKGTGRSEKGP